MSRSDLIRQKILEAFGDVPRPDLSLRAIRELGCCEEHDADFNWYREHTWQEFAREISSAYLDRFEFFALHPVAYHYFVPGLLLGILESITTGTDDYHLWEGDWVCNLTPSKGRVERFRADYLPLFNAPQRDAVASYLEFFNEWNVERQGYGDKGIERELAQVWRSET